MSETLVQRGVLKGHRNWVTGIATCFENPNAHSQKCDADTTASFRGERLQIKKRSAAKAVIPMFQITSLESST